MRNFTNREKDIIKQLVSARSIDETCLASILDKNMGVIALEWDESYSTLKLIFEKGTNGEEKFNLLCEMLFLIRFLEENRYISLYGVELTDDKRLYNRRKYKRDEDGRYFVSVMGGLGGFLQGAFEINSNIGKILEHYYLSFFYVSEALRDLVKNDFKTEEQIQFEKSYHLSRKSLNLAFWIGLLSLVIGVLGILTTIKYSNSVSNPVKCELSAE